MPQWYVYMTYATKTTMTITILGRRLGIETEHFSALHIYDMVTWTENVKKENVKKENAIFEGI